MQILCIIMRFLKHRGCKCTNYTHANDNLEVNAVLKMALHHPLGYSKEKLWLLESFLRSPLYRLSNCFTTTAVKQLSKNCSYWEDVSSNPDRIYKKAIGQFLYRCLQIKILHKQISALEMGVIFTKNIIWFSIWEFKCDIICLCSSRGFKTVKVQHWWSKYISYILKY